ncbi:MAG TPA: hypothetical protein VGE41_08255 [Verrucomicrobiae bacterium]|jgi:hypothetical protein
MSRQKQLLFSAAALVLIGLGFMLYLRNQPPDFQNLDRADVLEIQSMVRKTLVPKLVSKLSWSGLQEMTGNLRMRLGTKVIAVTNLINDVLLVRVKPSVGHEFNFPVEKRGGVWKLWSPPPAARNPVLPKVPSLITPPPGTNTTDGSYI